MDPRFTRDNILNRRKQEWTLDAIQYHLDQIFGTVQMIEGWVYQGSSWRPSQKPTKKEDLKKSVFRIIVCKMIAPDGKEHEYPIQVPTLVYDQFFYIGGFLKVPIFQLYDLPIIYREVSKTTSMLKLRTNSISMSVDLNRRDGNINVQVFNKDVPFDVLLASVHTREEVAEFLDSHPSYMDNEYIVRIMEGAEFHWDQARNYQQTCEYLGQFFMNQPSEKYRKGEGTLFSIKAAYEVDHFTRQFFHTNSILLELLYAIGEGPKSDTDVRRKRIRLAEYILSPMVRKMYDMLIAIKKTHKDKFSIPQNILIDNCNSSTPKNGKNDVAHIIHYNFPVNPVGELAALMQCSLVGPGGFKKDNVPPHLRNMDESQFGLICPADTPDREGCGVIQNLVPIVDIKENGMFNAVVDETVLTSLPINLVPFMEHDDATRLQMASNQIKQTILLVDSEKATVRSGLESAYLERTNFLHVAKHNGIVTYVDPFFMVVAYDDVTDENEPKAEVFNIRYRPLYLNSIDYVERKFNTGERFEKGEILCSSRFLKDGELSLGRNFLTAVIPWKGFNYEDGIMISESVSKKMTSIHSVELSFQVESGQVLLSLEKDGYVPLPKPNQILKKGQVYGKIKTLDWENGFDNINEAPIEQVSPIDCKVASVEIFPNTWNKRIDDFDAKIDTLVAEQSMRFDVLVSSLEPYMSKEELDTFIMVNGLSSLNCDDQHIGKYHVKGEKVGGILFRIRGVYEEAIGIGDKIANRHGNKGVIAKVIPDDQMPLLEDGRHPDVIINPLGIVSRMNVGQLCELHMGEAVYQLKKKLKARLIAGEIDELISDLLTFLNIIDETPNKWASAQVLEDFKRIQDEKGTETAIDELYVIQPSYQSTSPMKLKQAMDYVGAQDKYMLTDVGTGLEIRKPIACGYMYFDKLVHRASDKISARSIGPYNKKTSQPMGGKSNRGGHRLGEMEVWAWLAHNAKDYLKDLLTVHSDSVAKKNAMLADILQNPMLIDEDEDKDNRPQSLRILESYLNVVGLSLNFGDEKLSDLYMSCKVNSEGEDRHD
jgi:DNA-directed RNA polymerase beta subunit